MKVPIIKGKKVILRPLSLRDAPNICKWFRDDEVTIFMQRYDHQPPTLKEEREWIRWTQRSRTQAVFSINTKSDQHIGSIGLHTIDSIHKRAILGIFIGNKWYWGQGLGTEATEMLLRFGFRKLRLHRIFLHVYAFNMRGIRSYKRVGFRKEGVLRKHLYRNGHFHDEIIMGVLKEEYLTKHSKSKKRKL